MPMLLVGAPSIWNVSPAYQWPLKTKGALKVISIVLGVSLFIGFWFLAFFSVRRLFQVERQDKTFTSR